MNSSYHPQIVSNQKERSNHWVICWEHVYWIT